MNGLVIRLTTRWAPYLVVNGGVIPTKFMSGNSSQKAEIKDFIKNQKKIKKNQIKKSNKKKNKLKNQKKTKKNKK